MKPLDNTLAMPYVPIPTYAFDYNPRCLSRSLNPIIVSLLNNQSQIDQLQAAPDINEFLKVMEPSEYTDMGVHGGGHHAVGGVMGNLFTSTQDPIFMLHHAMVDRMWDQWQEQDPANRRYALNGTAIIYNPPDAPLVTVDTVVEFGVLDSPKTVKELMDPRDYGFCYVYT
jgi:tyrosinase